MISQGGKRIRFSIAPGLFSFIVNKWGEAFHHSGMLQKQAINDTSHDFCFHTGAFLIGRQMWWRVLSFLLHLRRDTLFKSGANQSSAPASYRRLNGTGKGHLGTEGMREGQNSQTFTFFIFNNAE